MATSGAQAESLLRSRQHYLFFTRISTRWVDNDVYGHINNANYYQFFDTVVNEYLIEQAGLDFRHDDIVAFVVASSCQYRTPVAHPEVIQAGMRVNRIGSSSVEYAVAVFAGEQSQAAAFGTFTHVYVNRAGAGEATSIPSVARMALERLCSV